MSNIRNIVPYFIEPPYTLRTRFTEKKFADKAADRPGVTRVDELTLEIERAERLDLIL